MNENLDLVEILKDCQLGTKLYSTVHGEVVFVAVDDRNVNFPIKTQKELSFPEFTEDGKFHADGECVLFPSKDQRDWSKFKVSKPKFDPNTLKPFDKALARVANDDEWIVTLCGFKHYTIDGLLSCFSCVNGAIFGYCIPYNEETKHLIGTTEEAPEHYRYWED